MLRFVFFIDIFYWIFIYIYITCLNMFLFFYIITIYPFFVKSWFLGNFFFEFWSQILKIWSIFWAPGAPNRYFEHFWTFSQNLLQNSSLEHFQSSRSSKMEVWIPCKILAYLFYFYIWSIFRSSPSQKMPEKKIMGSASSENAFIRIFKLSIRFPKFWHIYRLIFKNWVEFWSIWMLLEARKAQNLIFQGF